MTQMNWKQLLSPDRVGTGVPGKITQERSPFQRDFDRIVFSGSFRRLQDKKFPLSDLRGEILFFDDAKQEAGVLRPPASFEILEMRFE